MTVLSVLTYVGCAFMLILVSFMGYQVTTQLKERKKKTGRYRK